MQNDMILFDTIADYCGFFGCEPQHPLVAVVRFEGGSNQVKEYVARWGLYALFLKQTKGCTINYGKTRYDYDDQSVVCLGPGQVTHTIVHSDDTTPCGIGLV